MIPRRPNERALQNQSAAVFRHVGSHIAPSTPTPQSPPRTLLQQEVDAWVNEGGKGDDA